MAEKSGGGPRFRAWILLQVNSPQKVAQELYDAIWMEGDDDYVVIRADVVDWDYNVVIPVDAASEDHLNRAYERILDITGAAKSVRLPVTQTFPRIPHDAHGFVTKEEFDQGQEKERIRPGRQHWSPGHNAWG